MVIKAVIFDLDGVLIDSRSFLLNSIKPKKQINLNQKAHSTYHAEFRSDDKNDIEKDLYSLSDIQEKMFISLQKKELGLAICSNAGKSFMQNVISKLGLEKYLNFFISYQDVDRPKPYPDIYIAAITKLGLSSDEVLICEDSENGIYAAQQSGAYVLRVYNIEDLSYGLIEKAINFTDSNDVCIIDSKELL